MSIWIGYVEITIREIIASVVIFAIMLIAGFAIDDKMDDAVMDHNRVYQTALKIEDPELFQYGMRTNSGNAFVSGTLRAVDPVSYPDISGEYMFVEKVREEHTRHTRRVAHTRTVNGKTQTYYTTEVYYTWDYAGQEEKSASEIEFNGVAFPVNKFDLPSASHIDTINETLSVRYVYNGIPAELTGTVFTRLAEGTISDDSDFYKDKTVVEAYEASLATDLSMFFWIIWILITGSLIFGFYYLENRWLY